MSLETARPKDAAGTATARPRDATAALLLRAVLPLLAALLAAPAARAADAAGPAAAPVQVDRVPSLLHGTRPAYPPEYADHQVQGEIMVDFVVAPDGTVQRAKAIHAADPRLAQYAVAAVSSWVFSPGMKNGRAVYTHMRVPVVFQARPASAAAQADPAKLALGALLDKGAAALAARDVQGAADAYNAAIRAAPDAAAGYLGRARAYAALGRTDEALDDFQQAADLDHANQAELDAFRKSLPDTQERRWAAQRYQTFAMVWRTVYETYFDPKFGGVDWLSVREKYRPLVSKAPDKAALLALLQGMLGELKRTHFAIVPREAAVFNPSERVRIGTAGAEVAFIEGGVVVTEVKPGGPAAAAGLRPGDRINALDGVSIDTTLATLAKSGLGAGRSSLYVTGFVESRLSGAVGKAVRLEVVAPVKDAKPRGVSVTCVANDAPWSEPIGYFPSTPIRCEARRGADGIGVIQFNIFVPPVMRQIKAFLRQVGPGDGLVIDLRGNGGGISVMAAGISGRLCRDEFVIGSMHQRTGVTELDVYPQSTVFDGPVAILIDGRSASTSEILAAGLKDHHRARVFGERSAGAALPSLFKGLPTGDLFQFAVADITTPAGTLLEGNGIEPDEVVLRTRADLAAGRDPVLDAARAWIERERRAPAGRKGA